jgi:hypothetical protein
VAHPDRYAMLLTALPYHGPLFGATQTPLSRFRLNQRLSLLGEGETRCLQDARRLIEWAQQAPERSDAQTVREARRVIERIDNDFVRDLVIWRLELRTLVAALRRRHRGEDVPRGRDWGFGRWVGHLQRHWHEPAFGLERAFPWLPEAERHLRNGAAVDLERLLLGVVWDRLERLSDGHYLDFEAILIYVLRWDLIARWTSYDSERALQRFDALLEHALADR